MRTPALLPLAVSLALAVPQIGCFFLQPNGRYTGAGPSSPASPDPAAEGKPAAAAGAGNVPTPAAAQQAAPKPMIPISVEVRSECGKTVPVFYGDGKPGFSSGRKSSISSNSISSEGRKPDGTLTIWLLDEHDDGTVNVHVTPDTRRVIVDHSCTSFRTE
jgi:hypothetical protein